MGDQTVKLAALLEGIFYDCRDSERLTHESPAEAVMDWLDHHHDPDKQLAAHVEELCPVTVKAYARDVVTDAWFQRAAANVVATLIETFDEEHSDDDGDHSCDAAVTAQRAEIEAMVRRVFAKVDPWQCHEVGAVTLDAAEVLALVRDVAPEWLTPATSGPEVPVDVASDGSRVSA